MTSLAASTSRFHAITALFLAVAMAAAVGAALGFQHIGGYIPCKLCYEQRLPYYVGAPLMMLAFLAAVARAPALVTRGLLLAGGLLMAYGLYLGVYHSGVEWGWWPGPTDCGMVVAPPDTGGKGVLDSIKVCAALLRQGGAAHSRPVAGGLERCRQPRFGGDRLSWGAGEGVVFGRTQAATGAPTAPVRHPSRDSPSSFHAGSWAGTACHCCGGRAPSADTASAWATS